MIKAHEPRLDNLPYGYEERIGRPTKMEKREFSLPPKSNRSEQELMESLEIQLFGHKLK